MKTFKWDEIEQEHFTPEQRKAIRTEAVRIVMEMNLRELRKAAGVTQAQHAAKLGKRQASISEMENQDDHRISAVRSYVEGLGGHLDVIATIGNKSIKLVGV